MKRNWKWKKYSMFLILALGFMISATAIWEAFAFTNGYEVTTSSKMHDGTEINSLQYEVRQKKASSSASVKYGTGQWYIFKNEIDANSATAMQWNSTSNAFPVSTTRVKRTDPDSSGVFYDTMEMMASSFVAGMKRICSRDELISGVTLYANRTLIKKNGSGAQTGGPYYNYTDFSKAASWSSGTLNSVLQGYNIPIYVQLSTASFNVRYVELDADGNEIGEMNIPDGFVFGGAKDSKGAPIGSTAIYGETLTFGAATYSGKDYVYKGYQWTSKADSSITAGSPSGFTMSNSYAPNGALELTFYFQKKAEVTAPPFVTIPPEEGEEPPVTVPPTTPPPPPPVVPQAYDINQSYIRYYSTDAGNWLGKYAKSTSDKVASFGGVDGNGSLSSITKRTSSYLVGTDASGNKWYFYADGTNATYVHPHTYNGYVAESADVKYITELVFPSTITYNGTTYTVTHIGGGTDKYAADDSDYTSAGILYKSYSYSKHYSEDYYLYDQTTSSPQLYKYHYVKMKYGILGNGEITSNACDNTMYVSGGVITSQQNKSYDNSYIFYNTTLKSVTIPSTVKTIEMYAFQYCQALETVNGGDGLTNIKFSAFLVDNKPTLSASNTWTDSGYQCYVYYYYNGDYSLSSPTSVMNAWQKASILAPAMSFPYMKSLQTIGELAFAYHYNLSDVDLPATIATIGKDAFLDCTLDNIRIPNASCSIYDASGSTKYYTTLGSKGRVENPTAIHTVPDSTAMSYGLKYDGYYKLYCGHPVTYYPNGGTPNSPVEIYSALNINYLEGAEPRKYANFTQSNSDSYSWYSEDYQYASYLDDDGVLYRIDLLNSRANVVSPGTTFTELVTAGSYNSAHYAWDSAGNLWFSGQYSMQSLDDEDDWYSRYSSMYDWRKVTLPAGAVDVQLDTWGVFVLDSSGYAWTVNPGSGSSRKINGNGDILFKKAYVCTYDGDGNDGMLIGITTEGKMVYAYEDYYGFDIDPYWSYNLTADNFRENTTMTSVLGGYNVKKIEKTPHGIYLFHTDTGEMVLWRGLIPYDTSNSKLTGYNITTMKYHGSFYESGYSYYDVYEMKDASGATYLGLIYGQSTPYCFMHNLGTGVTVKDAFDFSPLYGNSWATDDWNDTTSYSGITVWTSDGYLTRYKASSYADGAVKYASTKFKKILYGYDNLYGLAEDGTLWSAGNNLYGQLGTSSSYDYEYPSSNDAMYLHSTGSRTYTDIYFSGSRWVIALGTDGNVYYAGEKPTTTYGGSYSDQKKYAFTALGSDYSWPAFSTGTARRYIKGYDYDTEIVTNLFAAPSGKQFKNWNTASGGTGTIYQPGDKVNLSAALTLYAQWETKPEQKKYVYFHANGGNGYMEPLVLAYSSSSATLPDCTFTRNNYKLKSPCWNTKADGTGTSYANGATITLTQNATHLYAQWYQDSTTVIKYNLVYMKYPYGTTNNTAWKSKTLTYEAQETIEGAPTSPSGTFTVTYSLNKASSMSTTPTMDTLTAANTTTTASTFEYWEMYRVIEGKLTSVHNRYSPNDVVKGLSQVTGDTIYMYPVQSAANASVLLPMADCDGYVFKGWSETAAGNEKIYPVYGEESEEVSTFTPVKNTTLYAVWEPETYDITLDGQSATTHTQTSVTMTFDALCPSVTVPSRTRYIFMGYFTGTNGAGTQYYDKDGNGLLRWQISNGSVTTLYAHWVPDKAVSYDANGGTGTMDTSWVDSDKDYLDLPANAFTAPTGYHFAYWCQTAAGCTGESASGHKHWADKGRVTGITGRITLYARWTANSYTVTLEPDGGQPTPAPTVKPTYDANMPSVTPPTRKYTVTFNANTGTCATTSLVSEYTFGGYFTGKNGTGTQYYKADGTSARTWNIAQNTTLYAKWTSASVTLTTPTKLGYTFQGWYTAASGGTKIGNAGDAYTPTADVTLYAQWKAKEYDITLNGRGATSTTHTETVHMTFDKKGANIVTPTKTGYTFRGYYTGTHGTGTKYYDENGVCVKEWTEDDKTQIYAYWTQDAVILPDVGDRTEPTPLLELDSEGSVGRTDAKGLLYADDYNSATGALTDLQPYLTYDTSASEGAIPGTEKIAFRAKMGSWMLHYKLHRNTGTDYVRFYVTVPYRTQYEQSTDEELVISAQQTKTYTFILPKVWSYWEILESGMYYPDSVTVTNGGMEGTTLNVSVDRTGSFATVPSEYDVEQYGVKENHVFWDEYDADGYPVLRITLTEEQYIISDIADILPDIDAHLEEICGTAAWSDTRQARVRSDRYSLEGHCILSDEWCLDGNGLGIRTEALTYFASSEVIGETSYLQTYKAGISLDETKPNGLYNTTAEIIYVGDSANVGAPEIKTVPLTDINPLRIHTPVACTGKVTGGMELTEEGYGMILKDALNFFSLHIDNTGTHRMSPGYGKKEFSVSLGGKSNLAVQNGAYLNQVQFPFDVYVDVDNDSKMPDGSCNTEGDYLLAAGTWLSLGKEEQQFYVPVTMKNGKYQINFRAIAVNCPRDEDGKYIVSEVQHQANVSPSSYVASDVISVEVKSYLRDFRIASAEQTMAAEQLEGGNQALTLKKGYGFSFEVLTQGEFYGENAKISIVPSYFWESADGSERQEVSLYRLEEVPQDVQRHCYAWEWEPVLLQHENYDVILQCFTGKGMIPADVLCVAKDFLLEEYAKLNTFTGKEEFFLRDGYLIIHFEITVQDNEGNLYVFDTWQDTELASDAKAEGWNYVPGDIIRYDLSKSIADDYEIGGSE